MRSQQIGRLGVVSMAVVGVIGVTGSPARGQTAPPERRTCNGQEVTVDLGLGESPTPWDDVIIGTDGPDVIVGSDRDVVCSLGGDDVITGVRHAWAGPGDDIVEVGLCGGVLYGEGGNDIITGCQVVGGLGDDDLFPALPDSYVQYTGSVGVQVSLARSGWQDTVGAGIDRLNGFRNIFGTDVDDMIYGSPDDDVIAALAGDDVVFGGDGNDFLSGIDGDDFLDGGAGDDVLYGDYKIAGDDVLIGGPGDDLMYGRGGIDTASYADSPSPVESQPVTSVQTTVIGWGTDHLRRIERIIGSSFDDILVGNGGRNSLWGRGGGDVIRGMGSRDHLYGGPGDDRLNGGIRIDTCHGNTGTDAAVDCEVLAGIP